MQYSGVVFFPFTRTERVSPSLVYFDILIFMTENFHHLIEELLLGPIVLLESREHLNWLSLCFLLLFFLYEFEMGSG